MPSQHSTHAVVARPTSAMAISSLVVGAIALLTSLLPIVNNISFFFALLGILFGLIGLVATLRGTRSGKVLVVIALVVNLTAASAVLVSQEIYSGALEEAFEGPAVVSTTTSGNSDPADAGQASPGTQNTDLAVGTAVQLASGLSVSVDAVQAGLPNYDGSTSTAVTVTYTNNGSSDVSFNMFDWEAQSPQGVKASSTVYFGTATAGEALNSGTLVPGGSVSGCVFFDGDVVKVFYNASLLSSTATATWAIA